MDFSKLFIPKQLLVARKRDFDFYELVIQNIVCSAWCGRRDLNLSYIAESLRGSYNPEEFPACVSTCRETSCVNIVFRTGQVLVTGARQVDTGYLSAHMFVDKMYRDLKVDINLYNFAVVNVVGSFGLGYALNIDLFVARNRLYTQWDPENFKGARYRPVLDNLKKITFILFDTGKIGKYLHAADIERCVNSVICITYQHLFLVIHNHEVITGGKRVEDIQHAYKFVYPMWESYKKGDEAYEIEEKYKRTRKNNSTKAAKKKTKKQQRESSCPTS